MKTTIPKFLRILLFFSTLLTFQTASAFYDPSLGRWVSRDSVNEPGAQLVRNVQNEAVVVTQPGRWVNRSLDERNEKNLFQYAYNSPPNFADAWGNNPIVPGLPPGSPPEVPPSNGPINRPRGSCPLVTSHTGPVKIYFRTDTDGHSCCITVVADPNSHVEVTNPDGSLTEFGGGGHNGNTEMTTCHNYPPGCIGAGRPGVGDISPWPYW